MTSKLIVLLATFLLVCADLQTENAHCGSCDNRCDGYVTQCQGGKCICISSGVEVCTGYGCPNLNTHAEHCGACFSACGENQECRDRQCLDCPTGTKRCWPDGGCTDILNNTSACGGCGVYCPYQSWCTEGECVCSGGRTVCREVNGSPFGECRDLPNDPRNCGACGNVVSADITEAIGVPGSLTEVPRWGNLRVRTVSELSIWMESLQCLWAHLALCRPNERQSALRRLQPAGEVRSVQRGLISVLQWYPMLGDCYNLSITAWHCGACGNDCGEGFCENGVCGPCDPGQLLCEGQCRNIATDNKHCGSCWNGCDGDGQYCLDGQCADSVCPEGQQWCGNVETGGCTSTKTDPNNLAGASGAVLGSRQSCGRQCGLFDKNQYCDNGVCLCRDTGRPTCTSGTACPDFQTNSWNCGGCGIFCEYGTECVGAMCLACPPERPNSCPNDACVNFLNDTRNCGECARSCPSSAECIDGACVCQGANTVLCGDKRAPWCADIMNSPFSCGGCNKLVSVPPAPVPFVRPECDENSQCVNGRCVACSSGFKRCGVSECKNVQNDNENCGSCYTKCEPGSNCLKGTCEANQGCGPGQTKCDGSCRNTANDNNHCGGCGVKCARGKNCSDGKCS
ncbi:unnamed protein product [Cutaneotrichosporon oleaginosum]